MIIGARLLPASLPLPREDSHVSATIIGHFNRNNTYTHTHTHTISSFKRNYLHQTRICGISFLVRQCMITLLTDINMLALGYELNDRGSRVRLPAGAGNFSLHHHVQTGSAAHPASYPMSTSFFPLRSKRPRCESDRSLPTSAEAKNVWGYNSTPQYSFITWCSVKRASTGTT